MRLQFFLLLQLVLLPSSLLFCQILQLKTPPVAAACVTTIVLAPRPSRFPPNLPFSPRACAHSELSSSLRAQTFSPDGPLTTTAMTLALPAVRVLPSFPLCFSLDSLFLKNPCVAIMWKKLVKVSPLSLPDISSLFEHIHELLPQHRLVPRQAGHRCFGWNLVIHSAAVY